MILPKIHQIKFILPGNIQNYRRSPFRCFWVSVKQISRRSAIHFIKKSLPYNVEPIVSYRSFQKNPHFLLNGTVFAKRL